MTIKSFITSGLGNPAPDIVTFGLYTNDFEKYLRCLQLVTFNDLRNKLKRMFVILFLTTGQCDEVEMQTLMTKCGGDILTGVKTRCAEKSTAEHYEHTIQYG